LRIRSWLDRAPLLLSAGYATATAGSALILLVLLVLAGRLLGAADYGRFKYALALTTIAETIMDIGLGHVTVRAVARERAGADRLFRHVLGLKLVWVSIGVALLLVVAPILRPDPSLVRLCYLMGISSAARSYLLTTRGLLQGLDRFDLEALVVVSDRLLLLALGAAALFAGYGLFGLAAAFVLGRLTMLAAAARLLRRIIGTVAPTFDRATWRGLQAAALPLGFFMIALNMYNYIDTVILGVMRSDAETGWYGASYSVYEGLTYAPSILASILTPRLSYLFVHDRSAFGPLLWRVLGAAVGLGVLLGALTLWAAGPILVLLFGAAYAPAARPLQILSAGAVFVFGTWILHAAAIATNLDRRLLLTTALGLGANVALNIAFIPRWGISGAAWATLVAEALTVALLFAQVHGRLSAERWSEDAGHR
jgi:O-antigen/teichoic acid export membrane protein